MPYYSTDIVINLDLFSSDRLLARGPVDSHFNARWQPFPGDDNRLFQQVPYYSTDIVINSDLFSSSPTVYSL